MSHILFNKLRTTETDYVTGHQHEAEEELGVYSSSSPHLFIMTKIEDCYSMDEIRILLGSIYEKYETEDMGRVIEPSIFCYTYANTNKEWNVF